MRKIFLIAAATLTLAAQAQTKQGTVVYERTTQAPVRAFGNNDLPAEVRAQLAKPRVSQFELLFTPEHSLWQFLPNAAAEDNNTISGGGVFIRMAGGQNEASYVS